VLHPVVRRRGPAGTHLMARPRRRARPQWKSAATGLRRPRVGLGGLDRGGTATAPSRRGVALRAGSARHRACRRQEHKCRCNEPMKGCGLGDPSKATPENWAHRRRRALFVEITNKLSLNACRILHGKTRNRQVLRWLHQHVKSRSSKIMGRGGSM